MDHPFYGKRINSREITNARLVSYERGVVLEYVVNHLECELLVCARERKKKGKEDEKYQEYQRLGWSGVDIKEYRITDSFTLDGKPDSTKPSPNDSEDVKTNSMGAQRSTTEEDVLNSLKAIYSDVAQFARETLSLYNQLYSIENGGADVWMRGSAGYPHNYIDANIQSIVYQLDFVIGDMKKINELKGDVSSSLCRKTFETFYGRAENVCNVIHAIKSKLNIIDKYCTGIDQGTNIINCIIHFLETAKQYCEDISHIHVRK